MLNLYMFIFLSFPIVFYVHAQGNSLESSGNVKEGSMENVILKKKIKIEKLK